MIRILLLLASIVTLSACQTIQGVGRDIEAAGEALEDAVDDNDDNDDDN